MRLDKYDVLCSHECKFVSFGILGMVQHKFKADPPMPPSLTGRNPSLAVEVVEGCPMCGSTRFFSRILDVYDWTFWCTEDSWSFALCEGCKSMYLIKRPMESSVQLAYSNYYTHDNSKQANKLTDKTISTIKAKIHKYSGVFSRLFRRLGVYPHTFLDDITRSVPGSIVDIGCGSGKLLSELAPEWKKTGIEFDPNAVSAARQKGLAISHGTFEVINEFKDEFDVIVCSHVLEHVHNPQLLLDLSVNALKQNGELWLQWPNPKADGLALFGKYWRGLEAPRHLCLMSKQSVIKHLKRRFGDLLEIRDVSSKYKKAAIYMRLASRSIYNGNAGEFSALSHLLELMKFWRYGAKIENYEFCTLVVKKKVIPPFIKGHQK